MFGKNKFKALNELEKAMLQSHKGKLSVEDFLKSTLLSTKIFILVDVPESADENAPFNTLHLDSLNDFDAIAIFTHPSRAKPFMSQYPLFQTVREVEASWLFRLVPPDMGVMLNPATEHELIIFPEDVPELTSSL